MGCTEGAPEVTLMEDSHTAHTSQGHHEHHETFPEVLCPALQLSKLEAHGPVGMDPEAMERITDWSISAMEIDSENCGFSASGRTHCPFEIQRGFQVGWKGTFEKECRDKTRGNDLKLRLALN